MCLASVNGGNQPNCIVFVGSLLRKDARKSAAEFLLFANGHWALVKVAGDTAGRRGRGNEKGQILRSGLSYKLVRLAGIEPTTPWFVAKYSIQLSYSRPEAGIIADFFLLANPRSLRRHGDRRAARIARGIARRRGDGVLAGSGLARVPVIAERAARALGLRLAVDDERRLDAGGARVVRRVDRDRDVAVDHTRHRIADGFRHADEIVQ